MNNDAWKKLGKGSFAEQLIEAHLEGRLDELTDRHVRRVLVVERLKAAWAPWLALLRSLQLLTRLAGGFIRGKHRQPPTQVHGGPDAASGAGAGAGGLPVAQFTGQFTGYSGGFVTVIPSPGAPPASASVTPASPFEDAGIRAGEVTAYRCWKVGADGFLRSVIYDSYVWKPGEIAEGDPGGGKHSGIYAYKSVLLLHNYGSPEQGTVTGTVEMWGEVYEHEHGYRAQYACIASIDDSPYYDAPALRKLYDLSKPKRQRKRKAKK